jgi:hypothetical protein
VNIPILEMPAYVRHAAADSYLRLRQPQQAEIYYRSLLLEKIILIMMFMQACIIHLLNRKNLSKQIS